jgi:hypothetical protein
MNKGAFHMRNIMQGIAVLVLAGVLLLLLIRLVSDTL